MTPPPDETPERPWVCAFGNPFCNAELARPRVGGDNRHAKCWRDNTRPTTAVYRQDEEEQKETWWVIHQDELLAALRRVAAGEDPDIVMIELEANSEREVDP